MGDDRAVARRTRQHDAVPATEREKQVRRRRTSVMDHASGMLPELVRKTTEASLLQFGVKLDDGHRGLVPVRGVEHEMLAFHQSEALVAFAEADVFEAARLPRKIDGDLPARRRRPETAKNKSRRNFRRWRQIRFFSASENAPSENSAAARKHAASTMNRFLRPPASPPGCHPPRNRVARSMTLPVR